MKRTEYLEKHGTQWRVQKKVPLKLRPIIGKAKLVQPLHTDSLVQANRLKWHFVKEFDRIIAEAAGQLRRNGGHPDPLVREAMEYRAELIKAEANPQARLEYDAYGEVVADGPMFFRGLIEDRTQELAESKGTTSASLFNGIAHGTDTPLLMLVSDWLAEAQMKPRQLVDYRRAVTKFDSWLVESDLPMSVERITRKIAGQYVSKAFVARAIHPRTTNKDLSCLSSYWKWLRAKGYVDDNVWREQAVKQPAASRSEQKRPYTDEELHKLLSGEAPIFLHDCIRVAALTGMRVEEIARLTVCDVVDGKIHVRKAKTAAGERTFPLHPNLAAIVSRRCEGKASGDYLFHELPTPAIGSPIERSQKVSKTFTRYRRSLGVDDRIDGHRQSRIDFHSFRRWFAARAVQALHNGATGYSQWTIAQVIGHSKGDMPLAMTMRYAGDDNWDAMTACVKAVTLPVDQP